MHGKPTSRSASIMRCAFWTVGLFAVALIAASWFANEWVLRLQRTVFGESVTREAASAAEAAASATPAAGVVDDDITERYKTPLVEGLGQMVQQQRELLGDAADDVSDRLGDTLAEADAMFAETKANNREAIRQANKQPRAGRGNSPNVVLVVTRRIVAGSADAADASPHLASLASTGITVEQVLLPPSGPATAMDALLTGRLRGANAGMNLPQMLWQAGYTTALVGDCSVAALVDNDAHGFDEWFGFRDADEAREVYPLNVWANGHQLGIAANQDGQQQIDFDRLVRAEVESYLRRHRNGRPFALLVNLPPRERDAVDALVGVITRAISDHRLVQQTLLAVLHLPADSSARDAGQPTSAELVMRWPGHLPDNQVVDEPASIVDVLPTIAEVVSAWQRPTRLDGTSRLSSWRSAAKRQP